jgi:hypothetical protein
MDSIRIPMDFHTKDSYGFPKDSYGFLKDPPKDSY